MSPRAAADRPSRLVGWGLAVLSLLMAVTVPVSLDGPVPAAIDGDPTRAILVLGSVVAVTFAAAGAALVHLRPGNLIGWLLLAVGLLHAVSNSASAYGVRALTDADRALPLGLAAAFTGSAATIPAFLLPTLVMPAVYPTGTPPSRFWRWYIGVCLSGITLLTLSAATVNGVSNFAVAGTRLPWNAPPWWGWATAGTSAVLLVPALGVVVVGTLVRVARARSPERQQLLWLVSVIVIVIATIVLPATEVPFMIAFACIPVAVMVGVLRYRLLGIELALRRTLLYAPLACLVALLIGGLTTALARLFPQGPLPLVAASAVVSILVIPVAGRLRLLADRLVLGDRTDPLTLVDRVGAGLEAASEDPVTSMLEAVAAASGASYAAVLGPHGDNLATLGEPTNDTLDLPLLHGGTELGVLRVGPRSSEPKVTVRDRRLLATLAPHLAVVVRSYLLTEELAWERDRVAAATAAERDRLRRDLHDGLGPSLSGIALGLEAAGTALELNPAKVPALLERTRLEAESAVREVRRVLGGLRPSTLEDLGLVGAVSDAAGSLGMGMPGGPRLELLIDPSLDVESAVEECAFRIITEAMTNVARHAGAGRCRVNIDQVEDGLSIEVSDDGRGFAVGYSQGHGLDSMRRRAVNANGWLSVASLQPHGTAVTALLPLAPRA
jgi:signal transduction histidine kinase